MRLALICLLVLAAYTHARHINGREFQLGLQEALFTNGREAGFETYWAAWSETSGMAYTDLNVYYSAREQYNVNDIENCGSDYIIRVRDYVFGDLDGLTTIDIKSKGSLEVEEAEAEPFQPGPNYEDVAIEQIEFDVHPCEADYASNTRVFIYEKQEFNTCSDVHAFYPNAINDSNELVEIGGTSIIYTAFRNGTYLQGYVTIDITINYPTLQDAIEDTNRSLSEFSYTIISDNGDIFSDEQTSKGIEIYEYMLTEIGSEGEDWPCADGTEIEDFFVEDFRVNSEESSNTSNSSNTSESSDSTNSSSSRSSSSSNSSNSPSSPSSSSFDSSNESSASVLLSSVLLLCLLIV